MRVDLPAPLAPRNAWISPARTVRSTPRNAAVPPKRLCKPTKETTGSDPAGAACIASAMAGHGRSPLFCFEGDLSTGASASSSNGSGCRFAASAARSGSPEAMASMISLCMSCIRAT